MIGVILGIAWLGLEDATDMQLSVAKRMVLVQEKVAEEPLKILRRLVNAIFQVIIIRPDKGIPKIPCVLGKNIIRDVEAQRAQVFDEKHSRCLWMERYSFGVKLKARSERSAAIRAETLSASSVRSDASRAGFSS